MAQSPKGAMVAVFDSRAHIEDLLFESLCISIENSSENTVVSGSESDIEKLLVILLSKNIHHKKLINQHAFHSAFMEPVLEEFSLVVEKIQLNPASIDIIPSTPDYLCSDLNSSEYWVQHLRKEVCFHKAIKQSVQDSDIMLEVGPGAALCSFVQSAISNENALAISSMANAKYADKEQSIFLNSLAQLWCVGIEVEFQKIRIGTEGKAFGLPTYEFEKQEYWLKSEKTTAEKRLIEEAEVSELAEKQRVSLSDIESELLTIWKNVLGMTDLTVNEDFFAVGGDSLLSVDIFSKIKAKYKITLPISTLFTYPTIELLVKKLIEELKLQDKMGLDKRDEPWDTSVVMQPGPEDNDKILFIVGGVGGNVNNLYGLAKNLGHEYKVVGLQTRGILEHNYHDTVEEMAKDHIQYIKLHQPKGPYLLAGYSYGAYTAFEIAKQFEEQGEQIGFLGLLDVYAPNLVCNAPELPTVAPLLKKWKAKFNWHYDNGVKNTIYMLIEKIKLKISPRSDNPIEVKYSEEHKRYEDFFSYWNKVSEKYNGSKINSKATLFVCPPLGYHEMLWFELDNFRGWSKMTTNTVEVIKLDYGHLEMMENENAPLIAKEMLQNI